jgi:hypothetical protein
MRSIRLGALVLLGSFAMTSAFLAEGAEARNTGKSVNTNARDCYGRTTLGRHGSISFIAQCTPPANLDPASLGFVGFESTVPIKSVHRFGSVGQVSKGLRCHRLDRYSVRCHAHKNPAGDIPDLNGAVVRGVFRPAGNPCDVVAGFSWMGGGCVGYNPENNICAGVGLAAFTRFGPPAGC